MKIPLIVSMIFLVGVIFATADIAHAETIPDWVKDNAGWWANDEINDVSFLDAIKYLVENDIINLESASITKHITIGLIPVEKAQELDANADALKEFLELRTGATVEIVIPTNYETIIEGMRFGHIDAAFMDTGPAWITHQRTGAQVVLAEIVAGKVNYQATVWTGVDDDTIHSIKDTIGKRVAFTSITGSSGFVRPMGTLVTEGHITIHGNDIVALESALADNFKSYTFAGGYKAALELLLNDNVDVAFGSDIAPQKYLDAQDQAKIRTVTTIGPVPSHVFMTSAEMSESTKDALVDALIELNYDEHNIILKNLYGADALVPTTTTMHIGDFGEFIDALTGLDQLILDKYNKSK